jgi:hypothetical protein
MCESGLAVARSEPWEMDSGTVAHASRLADGSLDALGPCDRERGIPRVTHGSSVADCANESATALGRECAHRAPEISARELGWAMRVPVGKRHERRLAL